MILMMILLKDILLYMKNFIEGSNEYRDEIKKVFFDKYLNNNICKILYNPRYIVYICNKNEINYQELPDL